MISKEMKTLLGRLYLLIGLVVAGIGVIASMIWGITPLYMPTTMLLVVLAWVDIVNKIENLNVPKISETVAESKKIVDEKLTKARLIPLVLDIGISTLLGAIIIGKVALPTFFSVSTSGFDAYTLLLWGVMPLICVAAWAIGLYNRAKYAYQMGGVGGLF